MKTRSLKNYSASVGVEVYDIDWNCHEELLELGRLCSSECIVLLNEDVSIEDLFNLMNKWGDPSRVFTHEYICDKNLRGVIGGKYLLTWGILVMLLVVI